MYNNFLEVGPQTKILIEFLNLYLGKLDLEYLCDLIV